MYQFSYAEVIDDSPAEMRARERAALTQAVEMLRMARETGASSREMTEALSFLRQLWSAFLEDLQNPGNELPMQLRAGLISIGIWINKEIDRIRSGTTKDLTAIIEINEIIRVGLA